MRCGWNWDQQQLKECRHPIHPTGHVSEFPFRVLRRSLVPLPICEIYGLSFFQTCSLHAPIPTGATVKVAARSVTLRILSIRLNFGFALLDKKADVDMLEVAES